MDDPLGVLGFGHAVGRATHVDGVVGEQVEGVVLELVVDRHELDGVLGVVVVPQSLHDLLGVVDPVVGHAGLEGRVLPPAAALAEDVVGIAVRRRDLGGDGGVAADEVAVAQVVEVGQRDADEGLVGLTGADRRAAAGVEGVDDEDAGAWRGGGVAAAGLGHLDGALGVGVPGVCVGGEAVDAEHVAGGGVDHDRPVVDRGGGRDQHLPAEAKLRAVLQPRGHDGRGSHRCARYGLDRDVDGCGLVELLAGVAAREGGGQRLAGAEHLTGVTDVHDELGAPYGDVVVLLDEGQVDHVAGGGDLGEEQLLLKHVAEARLLHDPGVRGLEDVVVDVDVGAGDLLDADAAGRHVRRAVGAGVLAFGCCRGRRVGRGVVGPGARGREHAEGDEGSGHTSRDDHGGGFSTGYPDGAGAWTDCVDVVS